MKNTILRNKDLFEMADLARKALESYERIRLVIKMVESNRALIDFMRSIPRPVFNPQFLAAVAEIQKIQKNIRQSLEDEAEGWGKVDRILFNLGWFPAREWGARHGRNGSWLYRKTL